ncbi:MAG: hypothetical protein ABIN74_13660 [Ferruginibacter sp.]
MNNDEKRNIEPIAKTAAINYKNFHLWMLIPFVISIIGFSYSYYAKLSSATFHQHVHGISATFWYILIIVQPYLITRKKNIRRHILLGTIGFLVAGIVAGSAFAIIPKNIDNVATLDPNGFFNPTVAYFFTLIDFVLVCMFTLSVGLAILNIKKRNLSGHVQWLMASVFFVLSPGLGRMLGIVAIIINQGNMEGITFLSMSVITLVVMMALIVFYYYKYGSFRHPSFILLVICHIPFLFAAQIGDNEFMRNLLRVIFK